MVKQGKKRRIPRALKIFLWILAVIIALPLLGLLYIGSPYFSATLGTFLTRQSGRNVALEGNIETHLFQSEPRIIFRNVKIGNAEWSKDPNMFEAGRIEVSIRPWPLLRGRVVLPELLIDQAKLVLEKNKEDKANWEFFQNPQASVVKKPIPESRSSVPIVQRLRLQDVNLVYRDPNKNIATDLKLDSASGNGGARESLKISGKGSFQKQEFSLDMTGDSILQLRESDTPYPFSVHTKIGATEADAEGTVQDPVKLEALDIQMHIKGANAADLFPILGIALPPTPHYELKGHLTRKDGNWLFEKFIGSLGTSSLTGSVVWHPNEKPPYFEGNFLSDNLNMADLSGFIGAEKKPDDPTRVIPDTALDISRLRAMNADVTFKGRHVRAPDLLDDFYLKVDLKNGTLKLEPVSFGIAKGKITANVTIEGQKDIPTTSMDVKFERLSLAQLFEPLAEKFGKDNVSAGLLGGQAKLKGDGKSLRDMLASSDGEIGIGMEGGQLSKLLLSLVGLDIFRSSGLVLTGDNPVPISCLVGDFNVQKGVMETQEFLIDSDVNVIRGKGTANLKDEGLDMRLYVYPKKPTLLSARSPLTLGGTFKSPKPGVDATALAARGGIATALALLAPPAALLAFVDPGLGGRSDCATFLHSFEKAQAASPVKEKPEVKIKPKATHPAKH